MQFFHTLTHTASRLTLALATALLLAPGFNAYAETPQPPTVDLSALPKLEPGWADLNPLRGNQAAIEIGRSAYNQTCARCHGPDADGSRSPAPDLRRLGRSCGRVNDAALKQRCLSDVDYYFRYSVQNGKIKLGVEHMPPWDGILSPTVVWAIRTFIESKPYVPPKTSLSQ